LEFSKPQKTRRRTDLQRVVFSRSAGAWRYLQLPELMVFCVQLATELTSCAAPRTVLHAATARHRQIVAAASGHGLDADAGDYLQD
jgi:hypothetical protein